MVHTEVPRDAPAGVYHLDTDPATTFRIAASVDDNYLVYFQPPYDVEGVTRPGAWYAVTSVGTDDPFTISSNTSTRAQEFMKDRRIAQLEHEASARTTPPTPARIELLTCWSICSWKHLEFCSKQCGSFSMLL